jgi:hypothetical protein
VTPIKSERQWDIFKLHVPLTTQVKRWRGDRFEYWGFETDDKPSWNFGGNREGMIIGYNDEAYMLWVQPFENIAYGGYHLRDFVYLVNGEYKHFEDIMNDAL